MQMLEKIKPLTIVTGHYGCGKTNFSLNLAVELSKQGETVTLVDLDIVNPYFRTSDYGELLAEHQIHLVAPVFAHSNLDAPSLPAEMYAAFEQTQGHVIVDAGGDDAGATALGRFSKLIQARDYQMLYVINRFRPQTASPEEAAALLREVENASHLKATAVVQNSHLQGQTAKEDILSSLPYAREVCSLLSLPLFCTTVPAPLWSMFSEEEKTCGLFPVEIFVRPPWNHDETGF